VSWQPAAIVYPDIELALTARYRAALDALTAPHAEGVHVSNRVPSPRRDRMVIVRRDGGTQAEMRDQPRVSIRVWAKTETDANNLAALVMALAASFVDGSPIVACPIAGRSGPYPVPDESEQPLRMMTVEFHTRGALVQGV
jgi:hypothetical protein